MLGAACLAVVHFTPLTAPTPQGPSLPPSLPQKLAQLHPYRFSPEQRWSCQLLLKNRFGPTSRPRQRQYSHLSYHGWPATNWEVGSQGAAGQGGRHAGPLGCLFATRAGREQRRRPGVAGSAGRGHEDPGNSGSRQGPRGMLDGPHCETLGESLSHSVLTGKTGLILPTPWAGVRQEDEYI